MFAATVPVRVISLERDVYRGLQRDLDRAMAAVRRVRVERAMSVDAAIAAEAAAPAASADELRAAVAATERSAASVDRVAPVLDGATLSAQLTRIRRLHSASARRMAYVALLDEEALTPRALTTILRRAPHDLEGSDHDLAEVLVAVARSGRLQVPEVREAFMRATRAIGSNAEYRRVMEVALRE
jgi:hypothetical protein